MQALRGLRMMVMALVAGCADRVVTIPAPAETGIAPVDASGDVELDSPDTYEGRMRPDARLQSCADTGLCEGNAECGGPTKECCNGDHWSGATCMCGEGFGCDALHECCVSKFRPEETTRRCYPQYNCLGY